MATLWTLAYEISKLSPSDLSLFASQLAAQRRNYPRIDGYVSDDSFMLSSVVNWTDTQIKKKVGAK